MKIEKLGLNLVKNALSRSELRQIMAGSGSGPFCCLCCIDEPPHCQTVLSPNSSNCNEFCAGDGWQDGELYPIGDCA